MNQVDVKSRRIVNDNISSVWSSNKSYVKFHKCVKKVHINRGFRPNVNGSSGDLSQKSIIELTEWVTNKPVVLDAKYLETSTIDHSHKKYKWCKS